MTIWDSFSKLTSQKRIRFGALLLAGAAAGLLLMGFVLRIPVGVSILVGLFLGSFGVAGAILEMIVKAIANSRAPITIQQTGKPYGWLRYSQGWILVDHVATVELYEDKNHQLTITLTFINGRELTISGNEAEQVSKMLDDIAMPLWAYTPAASEPTQAESY